MINDVSNKSGSTRARSKSLTEMKKMSKLQVINHFKELYNSSPSYLKQRLEIEDVESLYNSQNKKKNTQTNLSKEVIIGLIETLNDGIQKLPDNVLAYLSKSKMSELKKIATFHKIKFYSTTKKAKLEDVLIEFYKSRPYAYLKDERFKVLAVEERNRENKNLIFNVPEVQIPRDQSKINPPKKDKDINEIKEKNLKKYQAVVMKFVQNMPVYEISKVLGVHYSIVQSWILKFEKYGDINAKVPKISKTKVLTEPMMNRIKEEYEKNPTINVKEIIPLIKSNFQIKIARSTVYKYLKTIGKFVRPKEKPVLNQNCKIQRRIYCQNMSSKSFKNIIFTDESMIELRRNKRKVLRLTGKKVYKRYVYSNMKLMVWGAISMKGIIHFQIIPQKQTVDSNYYCHTIISGLVEKIIEKKYQKWILMHDNAPSHKSQETKEYLDQLKIKRLSHPPNSPDLNPIELIWNLLKKKIEESQPKSLIELQSAAIKSWESLDKKVIINCIKGLRKVMLNVIQSNGDNIFIPRPKRYKRVNYKEEDFNSKPDKDDALFYYNSYQLKFKRDLIKRLKNIKNQIKDFQNKGKRYLEKKEIDNINNKITRLYKIGVRKARKLLQKFKFEDEYFLKKKIITSDIK